MKCEPFKDGVLETCARKSAADVSSLITSLVNAYLPDSGKSKDDLINGVIGAVDNEAVFEALRLSADPRRKAL